MKEKVTPPENKPDLRVIIFIPLAVIIIGLFVMMHLKSPIPERSEKGPMAPDFTFQDLEGKSVSLSDYRGKKIVLLNIWATWCPPCVAETPSLEKLYNEFKDEDFTLLAVSIDEGGREDILPFMERKNLTFPVLIDTEGTIMNLYGATGVPESFIVLKDGTIDNKIEGAIDWMSPKVTEHVRQLLQE